MSTPRELGPGYSPPLRVARLVATRSGEVERGPAVTLNANEASVRLLQDGELAWVHGPRHSDLAVVRIDDAMPRGEVVLRDVVGASPSEIVRVVKPDLDAATRRRFFV